MLYDIVMKHTNMGLEHFNMLNNVIKGMLHSDMFNMLYLILYIIYLTLAIYVARFITCYIILSRLYNIALLYNIETWVQNISTC